jgi:hypothetical protein
MYRNEKPTGHTNKGEDEKKKKKAKKIDNWG